MKLEREAGMRMMLADIRAEVRYTSGMIGRDALNERVMQAMAAVPRDEFVPHNLKQAAFNNGPLSIGHGQTISQPYIVALMTDLLEIQPEHKVLEIGTGSGYQTAVLSVLCQEVYSMDVIPELAEAAEKRLRRMGYKNIHIHSGNGYQGWPNHAPYDGIIVTAAAPQIPQALVEQLKPGGHLVIPVGLPNMHQELMLVTKDFQGNANVQSMLGVAFVTMVGTN